ncbi:SH3 domain-binding protein 5-like isoform X2 [Macrosteles quadrilineatus]|uniref:SH3 domain-binding protein 5-like isoform X2 n=1 Tax=Macrosteles quadrilineatus TaxID=74068 RepID=UPI0023E0F26C|nr:SH3 domain-binding protein 5-like isoform X2 [Macrosteles quadrilineatus]
MSGSSSKDNDLYRNDEAVDPRVQIELERLNAATDDINKLEVDLDEARANFRQLLCESSVRIDALGKKLGSCVDKARPYYEARIRAKEALHETQMAAVRFERANSAHAAAKEMVYLAEEGLNAEGRTFDHAWQEMLNHATMRVNESELERTLSEAEHRRTSHTYQQAETSVQQLQKELKRSIAKSRSYFEMKAQFNQVLEEQKTKVKYLEQKVATAKSSYAEALRNLEQISDEIHRIRKNKSEPTGLGVRGAGVGADSPLTSATVSTSTNPDTDRWTDSIGSSDSEHHEEYLRLPDKLGSSSSPIVPRNIHKDESENSEYLSLSTVSEGRLRANHSKEAREVSDLSSVSLSSQVQSSQPYQLLNKDDLRKSLETSEDENMIHTLFSKIVPGKMRAGGKASESDDTSVRDLEDHNQETWSEVSLASPHCRAEVWTEVNLNDSSSPGSDLADHNQDSKQTNTEDLSTLTTSKSKPDSTLTNWISRSSVEQGNNSRRQSLDTLILGGLATGERVKEIFSQGIMKLNISSLTDRRSSEPKFEKSNVKLPGTKKVPSPLEKSMAYLHPEDDSTSDSESLASVEMLTDDQISSLMLEQDLQEVCQNVLGTPISEVAPLFAP